MIELRDSHRACWRANRYAVLRGALSPEEREALRADVEELASRPETPGRWMQYFEGADRQLCRIEDFVPYHGGLRAFLSRPDLAAVLAELFDEPAVLFKEKINFKGPGGQGFTEHQDAPAFASFGQRYHITLMVGVDATTPENGCLEMVDGHADREILPQAADGTLRSDVVSRLEWRPLPTEPGDVVLFDSYVPHRSGPNRSGASRRALYVTYNGLSEGDRRADYYARKRRAFPPECERGPDHEPSEESRLFNLGNPIR